MDEETYNLVSSFKLIAAHYAKKSFIFDFIAWFPVELIVDTSTDYGEKGRLFRILRLLRLPRLAQLLDVEKCKSIVNEFYNKKLKMAVLRNDNTFSFPIMNVIILVHTYKLFTIVMIIFAISYFLGIFWLIYVRDIESWEYMTIYDVY
jgi:hypothetical protein